MRAADVALGVAIGLAAGLAIGSLASRSRDGAAPPAQSAGPVAPPEVPTPRLSLAPAPGLARDDASPARSATAPGNVAGGPALGTYEALVVDGRGGWPEDLVRHFGTDDDAALRALGSGLARARRESDGHAAESMLRLLRHVKAPAALGLILEALAWDDDRPEIANRERLFEELLLGVKDPRVAPALAEKLRLKAAAHPTYDLRHYARVLGTTRSPEGIGLLKDLYLGRVHGDWQAPKAGLFGLVRTGDPAVFDFLVSVKDPPFLEYAPELLRLGRDEIVRRMTQYASRADADPQLLPAFAYAVAKAGDPERDGFALGASASAEERRRVYDVCFAGRMELADDQKRTASAIEALGNPDPAVRLATIDEIGREEFMHTEEALAATEAALARETESYLRVQLKRTITSVRATIRLDELSK